MSALAPILLVSFFLAQETSAPVKAEGVATAPILMELYSDYQCPTCKALHEGTLRQLIADYVTKGKVYLIYRDFPLPQHAYAREAACYANAALRIHKYDQVSDALFEQQASWSASGKIDEVVARVLTAAEMQKVRALAKDPKLNGELDQDIEMGRRARVSQTPTIVLTHRFRVYPVAGNVSYPILRRFLDQLLSQ